MLISSCQLAVWLASFLFVEPSKESLARYFVFLSHPVLNIQCNDRVHRSCTTALFTSEKTTKELKEMIYGKHMGLHLNKPAPNQSSQRLQCDPYSKDNRHCLKRYVVYLVSLVAYYYSISNYKLCITYETKIYITRHLKNRQYSEQRHRKHYYL